MVSGIYTAVLSIKYNVWSGTVNGNYAYDVYYYERPSTRIGPYMVGMLSGFFMYEYKLGSLIYINKFANYVKNSKSFQCFLYVIGIFGFIIILHIYFILNNYYFPIIDLIYLITHRNVTVIFVFMFTLPLMLGKGETIRKFLSHDIFYMLAKLSYGTYMLQLLILDFYTFTRRNITYFYYSLVLPKVIPYFIVIYAFAAMVFMFIEQPIFSLERILLVKTTPKKLKT